ncbi:ANTH-domain-containing protein [Meredithblackwellia eburnea MCA 4105]
MNKLVTLATKPKRAPPKAKYIDPIVQSTFSQNGSMQEIVRALGSRMREDNSTVVFKSLIVLHTLLRSGSLEPTFTYLSSSSTSLSLSPSSHDSPNIAAYASYLAARIKSYGNIKRDVIRDKSDRRNSANRLRSLGVEQGLLREVREVQRMIASLVEAKFYLDDISDDVSMTALRLLVKDLLVLFQAVNEGVINVLEHYFEMSHVDATTALKIYKTFCRDTEKVVAYLGVAKKLHNVLNVQVPNLKHAPVSLVASLEEYLNDPNFAANREEYKENKRIADGGAPKPKPSTPAPSSNTPTTPAASSSTAPTTTTPGGKTSFTDFFESIESAQTTMFDPSTSSPSTQYFQQQAGFNPFLQAQPTGMAFLQQQPTGFQPQFSTFPAVSGVAAPNPFLQPQMTGFVQQQAQPQLQPAFLQSQPTAFPGLQPQMTGAVNPFRQSMMLTGAPAGNPFGQPQFLQAQPTGVFAQSQQPLVAQPTGAFAAFSQPLAGQPTGAFAPTPQQQLPMQTGPFATRGPSSSPFAISGPSSSPFAVPTPSKSNSNPFPPSQQQPFSAPSDVQHRSASSTPTPQPLSVQKTGTRNPFNPTPGEAPPPPKTPTGPSMNQMAASAFAGSGGMNGFGGGQQQQQQQQQGYVNGGMNGSGNGSGSGFLGSASAAPPPQSVQAITPTKTGGLMASIASEFTINRTTSPTSFAGGPPSSSVPPASGAMAGGSAFGSSSLPPLSGMGTGFQPTSAFGTSTSTSTSLAPSVSPLRAQTTGFGGSTMKPFQPTSSFGSKLADEFGVGPVSSATTTPLTAQMTGSGFNPFRASSFGTVGAGTGASFSSNGLSFPGASGAFASSSSNSTQFPSALTSQPTGVSAFKPSSAFGTSNFGNGGSGGGQGQGSLI